MLKGLTHTREHGGGRKLDAVQERARLAAQKVNAHDAIARETRGLLKLEMSNKDYVLSADEAGYGQFDLTGPHTAVRRLKFPRETDETSRVVWISNVTAGGFGVTIWNEDGEVTVASLTTKAVRISAAGPATLA